uniref:Cadherin domain-containing protein n=1 Tax=Capra hircus TaxID=9925 RepID=A0A8C2P1U2_CAPHI
MEARRFPCSRQRQVLFLLLFGGVSLAGSGFGRYSVTEETERGSFVVNIAKDLGLGDKELLARGARVVSDDNKQHLEPCMLYFQILMDNPFQIYRIELRLWVEDINDHTPTFTDKHILLKISESTAPGTSFQMDSAQDLDVGKNGVQNYTLNPNLHFHLKLQDSEDGRKYPELLLDQPLDREKEPELRLTLTALDGGSPPRSGTALVCVLVLDINDNAPQFERSVYEVPIPENSPLDFLVVRVSATDLDTGINGELSYSFSHVSRDIQKTFEIHPISGEVRLKAFLDFELVQSYTINIQAIDGGSLSGKSVILVRVVDVNDNPPVVVVTSLTSPIPENSSPEMVVAVFSLRDQDSGDNGRMVCSIQDNIPFLLKPNFKNFYTLETESPLDRENKAEYIITITVTDMGTPRLKTEHNITVILVLDINDNAPEFSQAHYQVQVLENSPVGALVVKVSARDLDTGTNGEVSYSLFYSSQEMSPTFELNSLSGEVRLIKKLDFETVPSYDLDIDAFDGGGLSGKCSVSIEVVDVNDNAPELTISSLTSPIPENSPETEEVQPSRIV